MFTKNQSPRAISVTKTHLMILKSPKISPMRVRTGVNKKKRLPRVTRRKPFVVEKRPIQMTVARRAKLMESQRSANLGLKYRLLQGSSSQFTLYSHRKTACSTMQQSSVLTKA